MTIFGIVLKGAWYKKSYYMYRSPLTSDAKSIRFYFASASNPPFNTHESPQEHCFKILSELMLGHAREISL
jgi:hypothetical protein